MDTKKITSCISLLLLTGSLLAQDYALKQLEESPRHHEWVELESNYRTLYSFVAYPEKPEGATVVLVIHENRGLNDWARSMTDQLAEAGFIGIAPDLLSNFSDSIKKTSDFASSDQARSAIYQLDKEQIIADLHKVFDYGRNIPAANGKVAVMGFCWGGSQCFRYSMNNTEVAASLVFYGTAPVSDPIPFTKINSPVYGFYGGDDQRVNATISKTDSIMGAWQKIYQYEIYDGAGHAFMRRGDDPNGSMENKNARDDSWKRLVQILKEL